MSIIPKEICRILGERQWQKYLKVPFDVNNVLNKTQCTSRNEHCV